MSPDSSFRADPRRTYALAVGIEHYDIGASWNLDGPAADAVRFVNWLSSRSVPADNIWLHLSLLENSDALKDLADPAIAVYKATRESIRNRITDLLGMPGDLLYLLWGGHGSTITSRDRRLYYADARAEDRQNLQINSLLDFLQSDRMKIKHQIAFIDACANIATDPGRLSFDQFPTVRSTPEVVQSFFFAAAPGQRTRNDAVRRGGAFSEQVQAVLDASPAGIFPPDPKSIIRTVKQHLDQPGQSGVSYESQDWEGNIRTSPGATEGPYLRFAARRLHLPSRLLEHLYSAFGKCPAMQSQQVRDDLATALTVPLQRQIYRPSEVLSDPPADLLRQFTAAWPLDSGETFQRTFERGEPISLESDEVSGLLVRLRLLEDARKQIEQLQQTPEIALLFAATVPGSALPREAPTEDFLGETLNLASDELIAFYELLTRIVEKCAADPNISGLEKLLNDCSPQTRQKIRAKLDAEAAGFAHSLLIQAVPGRPDRLSALWVREDLRLMRKWEVECPAEEGAVQAKVIEMLTEIWQTGDFPLSIEVFLVPQTLHWTPDFWERADEFSQPERVSTRHPVFVHWIKRWSEPGTAGDWSRVSDAIRTRMESGAPPACSFVQSGEGNASALTEDLIQGKRGPLLAFTFPIRMEPGKMPPRELITAIKAGAPYVCWLRESPEDWERFEKEVGSFFPEPPHPRHLEEIPYRIFKARKAAAEVPPPDPPVIVGGKLTLLWDDSRRSPFEKKYRPPT